MLTHGQSSYYLKNKVKRQVASHFLSRTEVKFSEACKYTMDYLGRVGKQWTRKVRGTREISERHWQCLKRG